ncbi:unnamed protein product [Cuscuta epithymum]|uniref:Myb-like domain-containing protein n=1 Tax=Cuscuta epithymum TaxID=186058 RepID=A0AAV0FCM5_9ASTE|nr:unnamed protein product [Cuscuta epithymum]
MEVEDEVVGSLEKSELSRKSKKRKEKINDIAAGNPIHSVKDVGAKGHKSIEKENLKKMKRDNDGVEKRKKTARDDAGTTLSDDTYGVASMKTEKRKRKKAATDDAGVVLFDDTNGVTFKKTEKRKRKRGDEISEKRIQENNRKDEQKVGTVAGDDYEKVKKKKKKNKTQKTEDDYGSHEVSHDVGVKGHNIIEKENLKKMKRDNDGVDKRKKTARDGAGITLSDDTYGVASMKTEKRKRKKAATDDAGVVLSDDTNGVTFKKTEKRKRKRGDEISEKRIQENNRKDEQQVGTVTGDDYEKVKKKKKRNKTQKTEDDYGSHEVSHDKDTTHDISVDAGGHMHQAETKASESNRKNEGRVDKAKKKKKKNKKKKRGHDVGSLDGERDSNINGKQVNRNSSKGKKQKSSKKNVTFSSEVEVFPASNFSEGGNDQNEEVKLVRGKRFSKEEDKIIKKAVYNYIEMHGLGEEGLDMVLNSKSYPEVRHCWKDIAAAIPYRPLEAVYHRTQVLFRRLENHKWSEEEKQLVLKHQKLKGNQWRELADALGSHRFHVKDLWRRIHLPNLKRGHWSQDEYQNLFDLVNKDLQLRISEEKKSKHGMLRDNVAWTAISNKLSTRTDSVCCVKWYGQLSSPMVAEGIWEDTDDFRMIDALYRMDATCVDNVDWDNLLEHRPGDICLKRWRQMVLHIGSYASKSFSEQVEVLANRYCPSLIEAREIWDNKPVVS